MIIFGTTSTRKLLGSGSFHCPQCGDDTRYEKRRAKKWGHLYWIPIIPMEELAPYVECQKCKSTFIEKVLESSQTNASIRAEFERASGLLLAKMALADGRVATEEIESIRGVLAKVTGRAFDVAGVQAFIDEARGDDRSVEDIAVALAATLNPSGVELVVRACLMVATADGELAKSETDLLSKVARGLGMSSAHFRGVLDEVLSPAH